MDEFLAIGLISDVLGLVKSGKEATVYSCAAGPAAYSRGHLMEDDPPLLAAKVYRPIEERGFKNDAVYQAGRFIRNRRDRLAFEKRGKAGRQIQFGGWINAEWQAMNALYAAGADVPRPIMRYGDAILMRYVGDEEAAAPVLAHVSLTRQEAPALFERVLRNVTILLSQHFVHGDLSAFNVLYWHGAVTLIDFPQAVDPRFNRNARDLLGRDVENVCRYFGRHGVEADAYRLAEDVWTRYLESDLP